MQQILAIFIAGISFVACHSQEKQPYFVNGSENLLQTALLKSERITDPIELAALFIDYPYIANSLEIPGDEKLVIELNGFDCVTLVENSLALAQSKGNSESYLNHLTELRYRNANIDGYLSRLHYFSEWIKNATNKGILKDITPEIGGLPFQPRVGYMTSNPERYPKLSSQSQIDSLKAIEAQINRLNLFYIPADSISLFEKGIQNGDVIAIVTSIPGLDITHVGFATTRNSKLFFLHASSENGKVEVSDTTLSDYIKAKKHMIGIIVLRRQIQNNS